MSALQPAMAFATTFLEGTLAGVFIGSAMMEHAARRMPAETWIAYNQAKGTVYEPVMPVFFGVTLVVSVAAASILPFSVELWLSAAALVGAGIITKVVNIPLNQAFASWTTTSYPKDWSTLRSRWQAWTLVRCALALVAFTATTLLVTSH